MPCRCDYMEPTEREIEATLVHELLNYVNAELRRAGGTGSVITGNVDSDTEALCDLLRMMSQPNEDHIVYNGRSAKARKLADWWDKHQEHDKLREAAEKHQARLRFLRETALAKLSREERQALGIK